MQISVNSNALEIARIFKRDVTDVMPDATAEAINNTRERITKGERRVMVRVFDRPTPYTMRSFYATKASARKLKSETGLRDWSPKGTAATKYIGPHVYGGPRNNTKFEGLLRARGIIGRSQFVVPAAGAELDSYGNVKRGTYTRILSAMGALRESGYQGNRTNSKRSLRKAAKYQYFVGAPDGEKQAIWQRLSQGQKFKGAIKPIFWVQDTAPRYRKRFAFFQIAENVHKAHYSSDFQAAITAAINVKP